DRAERGERGEGLELAERVERRLEARAHARAIAEQPVRDVQVPEEEDVDEEVHRELEAELGAGDEALERARDLARLFAGGEGAFAQRDEERRVEARLLDEAPHREERLERALARGDEIEERAASGAREGGDEELPREERERDGRGNQVELGRDECREEERRREERIAPRPRREGRALVAPREAEEGLGVEALAALAAPRGLRWERADRVRLERLAERDLRRELLHGALPLARELGCGGAAEHRDERLGPARRVAHVDPVCERATAEEVDVAGVGMVGGTRGA